VDKKGGLIGPQLDGVGNWGKTALATKILDPNRNITENFRTYNISLNNGQAVSGLFRREEGQTVVLADQTGKEFSVSKPDIKEMTPSKYTLMPDNFNTELSKEEFDALLTYLLNTK
jgi:putative heme-binding domain-containing protein